MLPETCIIDDIHSDEPNDTDSTMTKRRSFGDQYMLFVRQNTSEYIENNFPAGRESIRDLIIMQDECISPLHDLVHRIDYAQLRSMYIVDCKLELQDGDCFTNLSLTTLVLSQTRLHRLPASLFEMDSLEMLRVDRNRLEEIPDEIGNLRKLKCFSCDTQRPRLRSLPLSLSSLDRLQTLSFCNNRIDSIAWVVGLSNLRTLRCSCNRITRLPNQLAHLSELTVLDVSHNRLDMIQPCLVDLVQRLYRFEYFNMTLRPRHVRHDKRQLLAYLRLENFFAAQPLSPTSTAGHDISIGIVGESHSGKSTLVEALRADKGLCKQDVAARESTFEINQFELRSVSGTLTSGSNDSRYISTIVLANDLLDNYSGAVHVDLYLLTVDLTALELQNGSQHLFARHMNRLQMWMQALYELAPDTPVLLVGTHAELVHGATPVELWDVLSELLEQARPHHSRRYADCRLGHCILCSPRVMQVRNVLAKSRSGSAGFVDLSYQHGVPLLNGHGSTSSEPPPGGTSLGRMRCPHIVGYYEIDSRKNLPKDAKKNNISIEQLKSAIIRLTMSGDEGISPNWLSFIRHVATIKERAPELPCVSYEQIVSISRSFDIAPAQVPYMLQYFHQRGKLVFFEGDTQMTKLVVINPTWFVLELSRLMDALESSRCGVTEVIACMQYKDIDRHLQKAGVSMAQWMLAALQRLEICVPFAMPAPHGGGEQRFLMPHLLEAGPPSSDVWADMPEWDEKQITCDFCIRVLKPRFFTDLILRLNDDGRRVLQIVTEPVPVFLSHHLVFYTSTDVGGCDDCYAVRRRLKRHHIGPGSPTPPPDHTSSQDDVLHKVHVQLHPRMESMRIAVRGVTPCCTMKVVINFLALYLDDLPEDETDCSSDRTSISSHALSSGSGSTSVCASVLNTNGSTSASASACSGGCSDRGSMTSQSHATTITTPTTTTNSTSTSDGDDEERQLFLLCPKCVLMRHVNPERICYHTMSPRRKAICSRWHNLGSWSRVVTGDYRVYDHINASCCLSLPEYEHPRLVLILPPSTQVSNRAWYMNNRLKFLEGFEVHFLCEYTGYWHFTDGCGFRLNQSPQFVKRVGSQMSSLLKMALSMLQVINGVPEHSMNGRLLSPVIADMVKMYDYLRNADRQLDDPYKWLSKNKDRVVSMLSKVLANCSDGFADLYFNISTALDADAIFHSPSNANRYDLARFLRIQASPNRFAQLRPLYVGKEIRWLCEAHYEELRHMPS